MPLIYLGACFETLARNPLATELTYCNYEELNSLKVSHDEFPLLLDSIKNLDFINEVSLISTCNRFEIYAFSKNQLQEQQIQEIKDAIKSVNKSNFELGVLLNEEAKLHFLRTYCGLNSSLIGENEISQQINISFGQSLAMGYMGSEGGRLLEKATRIRKFFDTEVYLKNISYCTVSIDASLKHCTKDALNKVVVLGSGSTAYQAVLSLINSGIPAENIHLVHRISSSSNQIATFKNNPNFERMHYSRSKYGYHTQKVKDIIFDANLLVCAIDSKNPVLHFPKNFHTGIIDFNSKPSCTFAEDAVLDKYFPGKKLDEFVRNHSRELLEDPVFSSKIELANNYLKANINDLSYDKISELSFQRM